VFSSETHEVLQTDGVPCERCFALSAFERVRDGPARCSFPRCRIGRILGGRPAAPADKVLPLKEKHEADYSAVRVSFGSSCVTNSFMYESETTKGLNVFRFGRSRRRRGGGTAAWGAGAQSLVNHHIPWPRRPVARRSPAPTRLTR
jgi:hypothetical protein